MNYKQPLSIIAGFGAIVLLSSVFARLQGAIYPESLTMLGRAEPGNADIVQLVIKLVGLALSSVLGGVLIRRIGGNLKAGILVSVLIMAVIAWLWFNTQRPLLFWLIAFIQVLPAVLLGSKAAEKQQRS